MKSLPRFLTFVLVVIALLASACGGKSYGSSQLANVTPGTGSYSQLNIPTPTPTQAEASLPQNQQTQAPQQQPKPVQTQQAPPPETIKIENDTCCAPNYFNPSAVGIYSGTTVNFVNADSVNRSVQTQEGPAQFNSGPIAPGKSWSYTFVKPGKYQLVDGTRPYATAVIQVQ